MKLNIDCVRDVMLKIEELQRVIVNDDGEVEKETLWINSLYSALPNHGKEDIFYALYNLDQAGYVNISVQWISGCVYTCAINHMTYAGHEFLNKIRPTTIWEKTTNTASKVGNYGLQMLEKIAEGVAAAYVKELLL